MTKIKVGDPVPVVLQIVKSESGLYPQAEIRDDAANLLTTLNMTHEASGLYVAATYNMPNEEFIKITYIIYTDAGHTTESGSYLRSVDVFVKDESNTVVPDAAGVAPTTSEIADGVWDELKAGHVVANSFGDYLDDEITSRAPSSEYDTAMAHLDVDVSSRNAIAPNTVIPDVAGTAATLHGVTDGLVTTVDGVVDTILIDTNELQVNQGNWATATSVTVSDKTGFSLSAAGVDAILDEDIEGTHTLREMIRLLASVLVGKVSGGGTTTITFRDVDDTKNRVVATVTDVGNRTAMTLTED